MAAQVLTTLLRLRRILYNRFKVVGVKSSDDLNRKRKLFWAKSQLAYTTQKNLSNNIILRTRAKSSFDVDKCWFITFCLIFLFYAHLSPSHLIKVFEDASFGNN